MSNKIQINQSNIFTLILIMLFYSQNSSADFTKGGDAYKNGDFKTAAEEFLKDAEKGDHRAMYAIGSMYSVGRGVEQNYKEAYKWFSRAAKHGRADAQYKLGLMYDKGIGIEQNYNKAGKYYSQAAKSGYPFAQYKLGLLYSNGHGVKQNYVKAYAWLVVAGLKLKYVASSVEDISSDNEPTDVEVASAQHRQNIATSFTESITDELEIIENNMTSEQLDEANKLAESYSRYRRRFR